MGREQCAIVDTYWQTETGGHIMTPLPGGNKTKPGPFFCFDYRLLDKAVRVVWVHVFLHLLCASLVSNIFIC